MTSTTTAATERPGPDERLPAVVSRSLRSPHFAWYWGDAIEIDGLLAAPAALAPGARPAVVDQLDRWASAAPDNFDDPLAPGLAMVRLARDGDLDGRAVDRFLASVDRLPELACGLPALEPHRLAFRFGFCIDALYHLPPALAAAGRWRDRPDRIRSAVEMALRGVEVLTCPSGWSQWYDDVVEHNNAIAWSRGIGWAVLGLLDLLEELDGTKAATRLGEIEDHAGRMLHRLAETQEADGNWRGVLDDELASVETSTAAFYVAAARHPRAAGIGGLPSGVLERAEHAVIEAVEDTGVVAGVSADILPGWDIEGYRTFGCEPSPWAQGAGLRALAAMLDGSADGSVLDGSAVDGGAPAAGAER